MKKIGIIDTDISLMGGVEITSLDLAENIVSQGFPAEIITCRMTRKISLPFAVIRNIGIGNKQKKLTGKNITDICRVIGEDHCEIVILQLNAPHRNCLLADRALIKGIAKDTAVYITLHNSPRSFITRYHFFGESMLEYNLKNFYTKMKYRPWTIKFLNEVQKYIAGYLTLSRGCKKELKDIYGIESRIQYNPYLWNKADCTFKKKYVLWAGRLSREKNLYLLLDAWSMLEPDIWKLKIAGDGEEKEKIAAYIRSKEIQNIEFMGEMKHQDLLSLMQESSIFVLTSFHEGFPTVITEAMNMRNAVITTGYDGISDELINDETAIVTKFDAAELADSMDKLMNNKTCLYQMQENACNNCKEFARKSVSSFAFL